jgi:hypothetical protein
MRSDMVGREVRLAHELSRRPADPVRLLPVRVAYTAALPYDLGACLDPVQYTLWQSEADTERVTREICAAVNAGKPLPNTTPKFETAVEAAVKELHDATEKRGAPLPAAELRFETGTVKLDSKFYVSRLEDDRVLGLVRAPGGDTILIKGVHQIGKSSLLARAAAAAGEAGGRVVHLDFQPAESSQIKDFDSLLCGLPGGWMPYSAPPRDRETSGVSRMDPNRTSPLTSNRPSSPRLRSRWCCCSTKWTSSSTKPITATISLARSATGTANSPCTLSRGTG